MDIDTPVTTAAANGAIEAIKPEAGTLKREIGHEVEGTVQREVEEAERVVKKIKVESRSEDGVVVKQEGDGRKKGVASIKAEYVQFFLMVSS